MNLLALLRRTVVVLTATVLTAHAQDSRPIRFIVPFPAGTTADGIARAITNHMGGTLKRTIYVDNKPGAGGEIAAREVLRTAPDGNTLLLGTSNPMSTIPAIRKVPPYDPIKDFTAIGLVAHYTHFILVPSSVPATTWAEFTEWAKKKPGGVNTAGVSVWHQIAYDQVMRGQKVDYTYVPYQGEPAAANDLLAGRIDFMLTTQGVALPLMQAGKVRALVASSPAGRHPLYPDVPTVVEMGWRPITDSWLAVFGPGGINPETRATLSAALAAAVADPQIQETLLRQGVAPAASSTPAALENHVRQTLEQWHKNIAEMGIPKE